LSGGGSQPIAAAARRSTFDFSKRRAEVASHDAFILKKLTLRNQAAAKRLG
jgi:hypothetical protein